MKDDSTRRRGQPSSGRLPPGSLERYFYEAERERERAKAPPPPAEPPPPLPAMTAPSMDFAVPSVRYTPSGAEELRAFRDQMLRQTALAWLAPAGGLLVAGLFALMGIRWLAGLVVFAAALGATLAPGLTTVFLIRRLKAGKQMKEMPQLPAARLRLGGRSSGEKP